MKGVIFDFNGTLFWDTHFHSEAFDVFLARYGKQFSEQEKMTKILGKSNDEIMEAVFERKLTAEEIAKYTIEKELIYQNLCKDSLIFAPGAEELFAHLRTNNIPYTIGSSVGVENIDFYYKYMPRLSEWFPRESIVYNDGSYRGKPAPDIFLAAVKKLKIEPKDAVVFEDSVAGIQAAECAGVGKIFIVKSINADFSAYSYQIITHFDQVQLPI